MKPRNVTVTVEQVPDSPPRRPHEAAQGLRAMNPKTNAHETSASTPCAVCGGACEPASVHWGPWRVHRGCRGLLTSPEGRLVAAGRIHGVEITRTDALLLLSAGLGVVVAFKDTHPEPVWSDVDPMRSRMRWRHVDADRLRAAAEQLLQLRADAGLVETTCTTGYCAWCGVREALGVWQSRGHRWPDGTDAPLCAACAVIFDRYGLSESSWWDDQRKGIAEAITGSPTMIEEHVPEGLRAYAEMEDDRGDGTPWSHLDADAVTAYRWAKWGRWNGRYAPPEHRAEAIGRARAAEELKMEARAAEDREQRAREDQFGFGVSR